VAFQLFNTRIEFHHGSGLEPKGDGLILPANDHLWMGTGPARIVKEAAGQEIEQEAVREGPASLGDVVVTSAGRLPFRHVLHAVVMEQDLHVREEGATASLKAALQRASKLGLSEVNYVLPRETGDKPLRPEILAKLVATLFEVLEETPKIQKLRVIAADEGSRRVLHDAFLQRLH